MKRLSLLLVFLIMLAAPMSAPLISAQEDDPATESSTVQSWWCTVGDTVLRSCPYWQDCEQILTYSPNTLLPVVDTTTGDRDYGSDLWLVVQDPVQGIEGYIHSTRARECQPEPWQTMPVVPDVSDAMHAVYERGQELGNYAGAFSKVGDCQNVEAYFLSHFDSAEQYDLGPYSSLQSTIAQFAGSWERDSAAVEAGYTVASALSPLWSDPARCESNETPLECEARLNNPAIVIISMETWNRTGKQPISEYEQYLSEVVVFWLDRGVVPILGTKADNLEGDYAINAAIARVAETYDVPLWNFWLAAQSLPGHGFDPNWSDGFHLLWARSFYNNPDRLRDGWPVRNLTALQTIDAVWTAITATGNSQD